MIYFKQATITTTTSLQYTTVISKLYAKLSTLFTGENEIMLLGIGVNINLIPNALYFSSTIDNSYRFFVNYATTTNNSYYSAVMKSNGSEYIYVNVSSTKAVTFADLSSGSATAGTYSIRYFEKKHVV